MATSSAGRLVASLPQGGEGRAAQGRRSSASWDGLQRGRLLSATFALVGEAGCEGVNARRVADRAGVSSRTFYEFFGDREDCLLAAFNHAVEDLELEARAGWESELGWTGRVRGALSALLVALDREPAVRRLVLVEALAAGPRVLASRARVLERVAGVVDQGRVNADAPSQLPPLVAEGVVGGVVGVIHARLLELHPRPLIELLGALMVMIVLPYRSGDTAARELKRPVPRPPARRRDGVGQPRHSLGAASPVDYRLTARAQSALAAVAGRPGLNNREVSELIGLSDQGQISRMMKRLQKQGLVENALAHAKRNVRAWRLTTDGEAVIDAHRSLKQAQRTTSSGGKLAAKGSGRRGKTISRRFRLTALTHEVLAAVASLSEQQPDPSNCEIAQAAAVKDQGQISKLLARLEAHGLLENTGGGYPAAGNAWRLTSRGEELLSASGPHELNSNGTGAKR